jgi:hypothetical protein
VQLGLQLLDQDRRLIDRDYARARLASDVAPGQQVALTVSCAAPESAGTYAMKLDMVAEGLTWFEPQGSATVTIPLVVNSSQS